MNFKKQRLFYLFSIALSVLILSFAFPGMFNLITRVTFAASGDLYAEDFEGYTVGADPDNWFDTDARNSMVGNDSLYKVSELNGNKVFGTSSTLTNIHSHYMGAGSEAYSNYRYTGRMRMTADRSGIGVTFYSDYPNSNKYYRLRRYNNRTFQISPYGTSVSGTTDTGVAPVPDTWYWFLVEVEDTGTQTNIRAKVWQEGTTEPVDWQIDAYDASATRATAGTIGVWSYTQGSKYWDDLTVTPLVPPANDLVLTVNTVGNGTVTVDPDQAQYTSGQAITLTATADPGWVFSGWSGDLTGNANPETLVITSNSNVTATFTELTTHTLTVSTVGNGTVAVNPNKPLYDFGEVVSLTATADPGWVFTGWSGDLTGSTNPEQMSISGDHFVTARFTEVTTHTLTMSTVGNGTVVVNPDKPLYDLGEVVTLTATAEPGWVFTGWSGDLSSITNPETLTMTGEKVVSATFIESTDLYTEDFEGYGLGADPNDWIDTDARNSLVENDSLFQISELDGNKVFGTSSTLTNIHSHYLGTGSDTYSNYRYTGRMRMTADRSGIGVTFFSEYPNSDKYYRLRRYNNRTFQISPYGTSVSGTTDTGVTPTPGAWYLFLVEVEDTGTQTNIKAKVWQEGTAEPIDWQVDAYDDSATRITAGTIGVWSYTQGSKYWDDLIVIPLIPPANDLVLTVNTVGNGTVTVDPDQVQYTSGQVITLTAASDPGWVFTGWSGDLTGITNPETLSMTGDKTVTATFTEITHTLSVSTVGSGTVTLNPDKPQYSDGEVVTLTAAPDPGWVFSGWSVDLTGVTNPETLTMTGDKVVTATFSEITHTLSVSTVGSGSVTLNPDKPQYSDGEAVSLTAAPDPGWVFTGWSGDLTGVTNPETLTMTGDKVVTATFTEITHTLSVSTVGSGSVTLNPDKPQYSDGEVVSLTAAPDPGWVFTGWSGDLTGGTNPETLTMTGDKVVTATFSEITHTLSVSTVGSGTVTLIPSKPQYSDGEAVTLTAAPDPGWVFTGWSGDLTGVTNPETLTMTGDKVVTATFTEITHTLSVSTVGSGTVTLNPDKPQYSYGEAVSLTAAPDPGWVFTGWSGDLTGVTNPETLTMTGDKVVTATFTEITHTLSVSTVGSGSVTLNPDKPQYSDGEVVSLTAAPDPGWVFTGWSGDLTGVTNPETLSMTGDKVVTATYVINPDPSLPSIDVYYGSDQQFGQLGNPQQWINILGNVTDPDGIATLTYSLNGGTDSALSIGPDTRRLADEGDFNVEVDYNELITGSNQVVIKATDNLGFVTTETVTVNYTSGNVWPLPYSIDWSTVSNIQDVSQVVDGLWTVTPGGIRSTQVDYDRVLAIGDLAWDDYEVIVPISVHGVDPDGYLWPSGSPGFGLTMRWTGHTDSPVVCTQPHCGWQPTGAGSWYDIGQNGPLLMDGAQDWSVSIAVGDTYYWKMRVETIPGTGSLYSLKVWEAGQTEPATWNLTRQRDLSDLANGSLIFIAHHVDVTLGDVIITPIGQSSYTLTVNSVGNGFVNLNPNKTTYNDGEVVTLTAIADPGWVFSGWSGDLTGSANPDTLTMNSDKTVTATFVEEGMYSLTVTTVGSGIVALNPDQPSYSDGEVVALTATADPGWVFSGWSGDLMGSVNPETLTMTSSKAVTATFAVDSPLVSDDFDQCTLDTSVWTFVDPLGDGTLDVAGGKAWLSVPAGTTHDTWGTSAADFSSTVPRIMQAASDTDFELEVKFEVDLSQQYQMAGVLIEQDENDMLRLEFLHDGAGVKIYAASFTEGAANTKYYTAITAGNPLYMRVTRVGDVWTQWYSYDGVAWTAMTSFTHAMTVTGVGTYVGNSTVANTVPVDYFYNTASPGAGDVPQFTVTVNPVGNGTVTKSPDQATYLCGEVVTLTATADPGWIFSSWSGDLMGSTNPEQLTLTGDHVVTATFVDDSALIYTLIVSTVGNGSVNLNPNKTAYNNGEVVTLTATADPGWVFSGWSGDLTGSANPDTLTMNSNKAVMATFVPETTYTLSVAAVGSGSVIVDPNQAAYSDGELVTLTATADPGWVFTGWSGDLSGSITPETLTMNSNKVVTATFAVTSPLVSDDFDQCTLDTGVWTFVDPLGDGTLDVAGGKAWLSVLAGTTHDTWGTSAANFSSTVPRIMQAASDTDFELEVKFEADLSMQYQMAGVLIEQDENDMLRLEFLHNGAGLNIYAASFTDGAVNQRYYTSIPEGNPLYMRVTRVSDVWTQWYSYDGVAWTAMTGFTHAMTVTGVGAYVGNSTVANTVAVDYFYNMAAPGAGDVPQFSVTVNTVGNGTVTKSPDQAAYLCGEVVTLTATADPDWVFSGWSGDLTGSTNPETLIISSDHIITATFE